MKYHKIAEQFYEANAQKNITKFICKIIPNRINSEYKINLTWRKKMNYVLMMKMIISEILSKLTSAVNVFDSFMDSNKKNEHQFNEVRGDYYNVVTIQSLTSVSDVFIGGIDRDISGEPF